MARLLGLDPGLRWVGLAITDEDQLIPRPFRIVDRTRESLEEVLQEVLRTYDVERVIVGYPTPLRTDSNERTRQVDRLIEEVIEPLPVPFETFSERYTTKEATRLRRERGGSDTAGDDEAAALVLKHYLEDRRRTRGPGST